VVGSVFIVMLLLGLIAKVPSKVKDDDDYDDNSGDRTDTQESDADAQQDAKRHKADTRNARHDDDAEQLALQILNRD
jgi:hypothetical protein